ncbi:MAG: restriction endonuclease [Leptolyngbya sp.]|nr:MAG: restriction endonuclease [Leptolyngbya sp.]
MAIVNYDGQGKPQIKRIEAFCSLRHGQIPNINETFRGILDSLDQAIRTECCDVTQSALNNCHGDWYEWIVACVAWNFRLTSNKKSMALLLPNISRFDVASLYTPDLYEHINDLRQKVLNSAGVQLITSNPDFVVISADSIQLGDTFNTPITEFTEDSIRKLKESYRLFIGKCSFNDIVAYLSVKSSFRPDRRLQIPHEGSLMKATYIHLQTREWIINPKGLKYYAAASKVGDADRDALKTVATHSITNVQSLPQAAVDEVFEINSVEQAHLAFSEIFPE